jgi:hypothetical protein
LSQPGVEVLAELLANAPHVKLPATSRESLGLHSEWVYAVQGLPIPDSRYAESSPQHTSVELFLQRARRAHVGFTATPEEYPAIVRICQLVDGNPLGIELAAAWVRIVSDEEIAREIGRGPDFLSVSTPCARSSSIRGSSSAKQSRESCFGFRCSWVGSDVRRQSKWQMQRSPCFPHW